MKEKSVEEAIKETEKTKVVKMDISDEQGSDTGVPVYKDIYNEHVDLDLAEDSDRLILMINEMARTMQVLTDAVIEAGKTNPKLTIATLGRDIKAAKKGIMHIVSDARLLAYGIRGGDNPYKEHWDKYLANKPELLEKARVAALEKIKRQKEMHDKNTEMLKKAKENIASIAGDKEPLDKQDAK